MKNRQKALKYSALVLASMALHLMIFFSLTWMNDFLLLNELYKRLNHQVLDKTKDLSAQIELIDLKEDAKQIVEQDKSINNIKPEDTKFVSRADQKVKKQTQARQNGAFKSSQPQAPSQASLAQKASKNLAQQKHQKSFSQLKSEAKKTKALGLNGLQPSMDPNEILKRTKDLKWAAQPSPNQYGSGPSQSDDYLKDIEKGDYTLLNTQKVEYFSYFSRVKGQLRSHWSPLIRERVSVLFYSSLNRSPASLDQKKTSLKITLNKSGYLETIELLSTSGNQSIDMAAIQAFQEAAPFLNPPEELLEKDKKIRFFWDFILES